MKLYNVRNLFPLLPHTLTVNITATFERLENLHGATLVCTALGCIVIYIYFVTKITLRFLDITAAREGMSTRELEEILSCSEMVLDSVYLYFLLSPLLVTSLIYIASLYTIP